MKKLSFITQFKIEFLLPFTGCRKMLGKMPAYCYMPNCKEGSLIAGMRWWIWSESLKKRDESLKKKGWVFFRSNSSISGT